jgi:hypothetical protein
MILLFSGLRNLDRDITTGARITRFPHLSHAASSDRRDAFIRPAFVALLERHLGVRAKVSRSGGKSRLYYGASGSYRQLKAPRYR